MAWTFVDKINLVTAIQRHGENWAAIASVLKLASGLAASGRECQSQFGSLCSSAAAHPAESSSSSSTSIATTTPQNPQIPLALLPYPPLAAPLINPLEPLTQSKTHLNSILAHLQTLRIHELKHLLAVNQTRFNQVSTEIGQFKTVTSDPKFLTSPHIPLPPSAQTDAIASRPGPSQNVLAPSSSSSIVPSTESGKTEQLKKEPVSQTDVSENLESQSLSKDNDHEPPETSSLKRPSPPPTLPTPSQKRFKSSPRAEYSRSDPLFSETETVSEDGTTTTTGQSESTIANGSSSKRGQDKTWRKLILMIWQNIQNHKYGNAFLNVDGRGKKAAAAAAAAAAGSAGNTGAGGSGVAGATGGNGDAGIIYRELIKRPMDLHMIKQRIKDGSCSSTTEFHRDILLTFANAIMYNTARSDTAKMARDILVAAESEINSHRWNEKIAAERRGSWALPGEVLSPTGTSGTSVSGSGSGRGSGSGSLTGTGMGNV